MTKQQNKKKMISSKNKQVSSNPVVETFTKQKLIKSQDQNELLNNLSLLSEKNFIKVDSPFDSSKPLIARLRKSKMRKRKSAFRYSGPLSLKKTKLLMRTNKNDAKMYSNTDKRKEVYEQRKDFEGSFSPRKAENEIVSPSQNECYNQNDETINIVNCLEMVSLLSKDKANFNESGESTKSDVEKYSGNSLQCIFKQVNLTKTCTLSGGKNLEQSSTAFITNSCNTLSKSPKKVNTFKSKCKPISSENKSLSQDVNVLAGKILVEKKPLTRLKSVKSDSKNSAPRSELHSEVKSLTDDVLNELNINSVRKKYNLRKRFNPASGNCLSPDKLDKRTLSSHTNNPHNLDTTIDYPQNIDPLIDLNNFTQNESCASSSNSEECNESLKSKNIQENVITSSEQNFRNKNQNNQVFDDQESNFEGCLSPRNSKDEIVPLSPKECYMELTNLPTSSEQNCRDKNQNNKVFDDQESNFEGCLSPRNSEDEIVPQSQNECCMELTNLPTYCISGISSSSFLRKRILIESENHTSDVNIEETIECKTNNRSNNCETNDYSDFHSKQKVASCVSLPDNNTNINNQIAVNKNSTSPYRSHVESKKIHEKIPFALKGRIKKDEEFNVFQIKNNNERNDKTDNSVNNDKCVETSGISSQHKINLTESVENIDTEVEENSANVEQFINQANLSKTSCILSGRENIKESSTVFITNSCNTLRSVPEKANTFKSKSKPIASENDSLSKDVNVLKGKILIEKKPMTRLKSVKSDSKNLALRSELHSEVKNLTDDVLNELYMNNKIKKNNLRKRFNSASGTDLSPDKLDIEKGKRMLSSDTNNPPNLDSSIDYPQNIDPLTDLNNSNQTKQNYSCGSSLKFEECNKISNSKKEDNFSENKNTSINISVLPDVRYKAANNTSVTSLSLSKSPKKKPIDTLYTTDEDSDRSNSSQQISRTQSDDKNVQESFTALTTNSCNNLNEVFDEINSLYDETRSNEIDSSPKTSSVFTVFTENTLEENNINKCKRRPNSDEDNLESSLDSGTEDHISMDCSEPPDNDCSNSSTSDNAKTNNKQSVKSSPRKKVLNASSRNLKAKSSDNGNISFENISYETEDHLSMDCSISSQSNDHNRLTLLSQKNNSSKSQCGYKKKSTFSPDKGQIKKKQNIKPSQRLKYSKHLDINSNSDKSFSRSSSDEIEDHLTSDSGQGLGNSDDNNAAADKSNIEAEVNNILSARHIHLLPDKNSHLRKKPRLSLGLKSSKRGSTDSTLSSGFHSEVKNQTDDVLNEIIVNKDRKEYNLRKRRSSSNGTCSSPDKPDSEKSNWMFSSQMDHSHHFDKTIGSSQKNYLKQVNKNNDSSRSSSNFEQSNETEQSEKEENITENKKTLIPNSGLPHICNESGKSIKDKSQNKKFINSNSDTDEDSDRSSNESNIIQWDSGGNPSEDPTDSDAIVTIDSFKINISQIVREAFKNWRLPTKIFKKMQAIDIELAYNGKKMNQSLKCNRRKVKLFKDLEEEERKLLYKGWLEFCKRHSFNKKKPQYFFNSPLFKQNFSFAFINYFCLFISKHLKNARSNIAILTNFQSLFDKKMINGSFSSYEDAVILALHKTIDNRLAFINCIAAFTLNRSVYSIEKRLRTLRSKGAFELRAPTIQHSKPKQKSNNDSKNVYDSESDYSCADQSDTTLGVETLNKRIESLKNTSDNLLDVLDKMLETSQNSRTTVVDILNKDFSKKYWKKVSSKLEDIPPHAAKALFLARIHPLFTSRQPVNKYKLIDDLINHFKSKNYTCWDDINWCNVSNIIGKFQALFVFTTFAEFVINEVPLQHHANFEECMDYILREKLDFVKKKIKERIVLNIC